MLTQSTHSFLFTEPTFSLPFNFALVIISISYICLLLALVNVLYEDYTPDNPFNVPVGVSTEVKIAQYLALLIGLIMEEEIPESLYLLRMITEKTLHQREPDLKYGKFIFCAVLRFIMGYLFYLNMFTVVVQATAVIDIFFDVLALQFLQQLDDIAFNLAKMDVFGKRIKRASTRKCFRAEFEKLPFGRRKKMSVFVKVMYIINLIGLMTGMAMVTIKQMNGYYHCQSITVQFDDRIWEKAYVMTDTGGVEQWALFYSYFNGVYVKNGTHHGRPVYTEQNKFDDTEFKVKTGAIIKYCDGEGAWVFMHEKIRKDIGRDDADCPWLLRSPETSSYNLLEVDSSWSIWTGVISTGSTFQTSCNKCYSDADCNYHGTCEDKKCVCDKRPIDGIPLYNGMQCQYSRPCPQLEGVEGDLWNIVPMDTCQPWKAYGRGVYSYYMGGNMSVDTTIDYVALIYSGSRWLATVHEDGKNKGMDYWLHYSKEVHAFWDKIYTKRTEVVSDPTLRADPIAVDFYKIGQRGPRHGPLGERIPIQEPPGSGYFQCAQLNTTINEFVAQILGRPDCANRS